MLLMNIAGFALVLCLIFTTGEVRCDAVDTCTEKYNNQSPTHTMCLTDNTDAVAGKLTADEKAAIVDQHNEIRRARTGAGNLLKMKWDDRLAQVALKWAMQCKFAHDSNRNEPELDGNVGQNLAYTKDPAQDFTWAIKTWADGVKFFDPDNWNKEAAYYIQQIYYATELVGCGKASCGNKKYFFCNYYQNASLAPFYASGDACAQCPDKCDNGLCDCTDGADTCHNGGTKEPASCTCQCLQNFYGDKCQALTCPVNEYSWCANYDTARCSNNPYLRSRCPYTCDLCSN